MVTELSLINKQEALDPVIANNTEYSEALKDYKDAVSSFAKVDPDFNSLAKCLSKVIEIETTIEKLNTKLKQDLGERVKQPISTFLNEDFAYATRCQEQYIKAEAAFKASDHKFQQLKASNKDEGAKIFELEKERNILSGKYANAVEQAEFNYKHTIEWNKFSILEAFCNQIELYQKFFKDGLKIFKNITEFLDTHKEFIKKKKLDYKNLEAKQTGKDDNIDVIGKVMHKGRLYKKTGKQWKKYYVELRYKYLYCFNNEEDKRSKSVVPLVQCSTTDVSSELHQENAFAITTKRKSFFFYCKSKSQHIEWINMIRQCTQDPEDHQVNLIKSGKEAIKGKDIVLAEELYDHPEPTVDTIGHSDLDKLNFINQFLRDEKRYVSRLKIITDTYLVPLTTDPKLKSKISPAEVDAIFCCGQIKELEAFHSDFLLDLEDAIASQNCDLSMTFFSAKDEIESLYTPYTNNVANGLKYLNMVSKKYKVINKFLKDRERRLGTENGLSILLALPIERLSQYIEFLDTLVSFEERAEKKKKVLSKSLQKEVDEAKANRRDTSLSAVCNILRALKSRIDENNATSRNLTSLLKIRKKLLDYEGLVSPDRELVKEGLVQASPIRKEEKVPMGKTYMFLFNDLILFTKPISSNKSIKNYRVWDSITLHKASFKDDDSKLQFEILEEGISKHAEPKKVHIKANSTEEKTAWVHEICNAISQVKANQKVYGVPIQILMCTEDRELGRDIPQVTEITIEWLVKYGLSFEGLFRLPGNLEVIEAYKELFNSGKEVEIPPDEDPANVAGLLSHWLMELPEAILTNRLHSSFCSCLKEKEDVERTVKKIKELIYSLPQPNRFLVQHLISFFQLIINEPANKMNVDNLAIVFGPTLLGMGPINISEGDATNMLEDINRNKQIVKFLIENYSAIFEDVEIERKEFKLAQQHEESEALQQEKELKKKAENTQRPIIRRKTLGRLASSAKKSAVGTSAPSLMSSYDSSITADSSDQTESQSPDVIKMGWVTKKGGNRRNWKTRFCVLRPNDLRYYKEKKGYLSGQAPLGTIVLSGCLVQVKPSSRRQYAFAIETSERTYIMEAKDEEERTDWINVIRLCLNKSDYVYK